MLNLSCIQWTWSVLEFPSGFFRADFEKSMRFDWCTMFAGHSFVIMIRVKIGNPIIPTKFSKWKRNAKRKRQSIDMQCRGLNLE